MSTSQFDPALFLDATTTEASVKRPPLPAGQVFRGIVGEPKSRAWTKRDDPSKGGIAIDVPIEIDLTPYKEALGPDFFGIDKVTLVDGIMVDMTVDQKGIDWSPGKNGKFRRWRDALNMNVAGEPFSPRMMQGRMVSVKISHRVHEGEIYDQVDSPVKA